MTIIVCAAFAAMCAMYLAFQRIKLAPGSSRALEISAKCGATAMAALVALLGCLKNGAPAHWVLLAGLAVCAVADGVLCVHLIAGGAVFVLGHILYMIAFCLMRRPDWRSAAVFLCLAGPAAAGIARFRDRLGRGYVLFFIYAAVLGLMVALAAVQGPLYLAGALLFAVSDGLLACLSLNRGNARLDYASLAAYYLGQFLLGLAVFI